jgi:hypothetical protein
LIEAASTARRRFLPTRGSGQAAALVWGQEEERLNAAKMAITSAPATSCGGPLAARTPRRGQRESRPRQGQSTPVRLDFCNAPGDFPAKPRVRSAVRSPDPARGYSLSRGISTAQQRTARSGGALDVRSTASVGGPVLGSAGLDPAGAISSRRAGLASWPAWPGATPDGPSPPPDWPSPAGTGRASRRSATSACRRSRGGSTGRR